MPVNENQTMPDPAQAGDPNLSAPQPSGEPGAPSPQTPNPAAVKPDGLPDKYWDEKAGLRVNEVAQTLTEFETENARRAETFKDFPEKPDEAGKFYKLPEQVLPEGVKLPEGVTFQPDEELLAAALPIFHKHKADPALFQDLTRAFNAHEVKRYQDAITEFAAEDKKLGAKAADRRKAVGEGLKALVGEDKSKFIDSGALSAQAVEFFESIIDKFSNQSNVVPLNQRRDDGPAPLPEKPWDRWYGPKPQKAS